MPPTAPHAPRDLGPAPWAVVFDLDETLIVEERAVADALVAVAREALPGRESEAEALARATREHARALWRAQAIWPWAHQVGISAAEGLVGRFDGPGEELAALRAFVPGYRVEAWRLALAERGNADVLLAARLAERYRVLHPARRTPYAETVEVLRALRPRALLGLLTNGAPDLQREKAQGAGLVPWFDVLVVSGDIGAGKPDPRVFLHVLDRLRVPPERAVMVGDNPERDIAGALGVGMRAVWIERTGTAAEPACRPHARVRTLTEVPRLLTAWAGG